VEQTFNNIIDMVQKLSLDEKEEVKFILDRSIVEQRREEIYNNYKDSKKEYEKSKLQFSDNMDELKIMVKK